MSKLDAASRKRAAPSEDEQPAAKKVKSAFTAAIEAKVGRPAAYDEDLTEPRAPTRYQANFAKSRPVKPLPKRAPSTYVNTMSNSKRGHESAFSTPVPRKPSKAVKPVIDIALNHIKSNNAKSASKSHTSNRPSTFASRVPNVIPTNYYDDNYDEHDGDAKYHENDAYTEHAVDSPNDYEDDLSTIKSDDTNAGVISETASVDCNLDTSTKHDKQNSTVYNSKHEDNRKGDVIKRPTILLPQPFHPFKPGTGIPSFEKRLPFELRNPAGLRTSSLILLSAQINEHAAKSSVFMKARAANAELVEKATKHKNEISDLLADVKKAEQVDMVGVLECKMVEAEEQWARAEDKRVLLEDVATELQGLEEKICELDWMVVGVEARIKEVGGGAVVQEDLEY